MDLDQDTPRSENLQNLTYTELRKVAFKYGINQRMKSEKLIAAILSKQSDTDNEFSEEEFSTPAVKELNSTRKNKEKKFDEDLATPLATPRRGTYSIETPLSVQTEDVSSVSLTVNVSDLDTSNVTMSRGSERKFRSRKVSFMSPEITPRTPKNPSLKNRPKTPIASRTPLNDSISSEQRKRKSLKDSFHWPTSDVKTIKFDEESDAETSAIFAADNSTPLQTSTHVIKENEKTKSKVSSQNIKSNTKTNTILASANLTPLPTNTYDVNKVGKTPKTRMSTRIAKSSTETNTVLALANSTPLPIKTQDVKDSGKTPKTRMSTRSIKYSGKKEVAIEEPTSLKRGVTPNFQRIHEKAFKKMESIDDYQKRKLLNSAKKISQRPNFKSKVTKAKSKIPGTSGIPFIPSVSSNLKLKAKVNKLVLPVDERKVAKENTPLPLKKSVDIKAKNIVRKDTPRPKPKFDISNRSLLKKETPQSVKSKSKFDLKASLSRKLGYKPYKGALKPLSESNSRHTSSSVNAQESAVNKVVKENRSQTRSIIKGVRMNKRFELQMKNRMLK